MNHTDWFCRLASLASAAIESHQVWPELTATRDRLIDDGDKTPLIGFESMVSIVRQHEKWLNRFRRLDSWGMVSR